MRHFVLVDRDGFVVSTLSADVVSKEVEEKYIEVESRPDITPPNMFTCKDGKLVDHGSPPSPSHKMDRKEKRWVLDNESAWSLVRSERNSLLADTDWMVTKAIETGVPMDPAWSAYRQALRDVTNQPDPTAISWPVKP